MFAQSSTADIKLNEPILAIATEDPRAYTLHMLDGTPNAGDTCSA